MKTPYLTKSRYLDGLRCEKKLWLGCHQRLPYEEAPPFSVLDTGNRIGRGALALFPGGVEVTEKPYEHEAAVVRTAELMAGDTPAIFEAAIEAQGIRIRVDILERLDEGWGLREVKSSTSASEEKGHVDDVAVQLYVLKGAGVDITSVELIHVNNTYRLESGGVVWPEMLIQRDLTLEANDRLLQVADKVPKMFGVLSLGEAPEVYATKSLCANPYPCDYFDHCMAAKPDDWIGLLTGIRLSRIQALRGRDVESIPDIPEDVKLPEKQALALDCLASGEIWVSEDLADALSSLGPPAYYMDFEAMASGIPAYVGTRPYETVPFQFSVHAIDEDGVLTHKAFLAEGDVHPGREFAEELISAIDHRDWPVMVYHQKYELDVLGALCEMFPDLAEDLGAIMKNVVDLLPAVRDHVCHPGFITKRALSSSTYSIKNVLPALVPSMNYTDLDGVAEGTEASRVLSAIAHGAYTGREADDYRQQLLDYCAQDTRAMVEIQKALHALCGSGAPPSDSSA